MGYMSVTGGRELYGNVDIQGSKNSVLPILAATLLNGGKNKIYNCPYLADVKISIEILRHLGCKVEFKDHVITVDSSNIVNNYIPDNLMCEMRSSIVFMGAIIARKKSAIMSLPGGCNIGKRPIDLHLKSFRSLGIKVGENDGFIHCDLDKMNPCEIKLDFPSVGATENIMLVASSLNGITTISNAACEPEICDLAKFLNTIGANVSGAGTSVITIEGTDKFKDASHAIIPDRIVASTFMAAAAVSRGVVKIRNVIPGHFASFTSVIEKTGTKVDIDDSSVTITAPKRIKSPGKIVTAPYPAFPTDTQSIIMSVLACSDGVTAICETIFEDRFKHAHELIKMGADIRITNSTAYVGGKDRLRGANVSACDLRSGAALIIAALNAEGETRISNLHYIDRGYDNIHNLLKSLGADIERVD